MKYLQLTLRLASIALAGLAWILQAAPLPSAVLYQGRLVDSAGPVNGQVDLRFRLYDAPVGGLQTGPTLTNANVAVSNGLFVATPDFGPGVFGANAAWLEIGVRPSQPTPVDFTTLTPRQPILPSPGSLYAVQAALANAVAPAGVDAAALQDGSVSAFKLALNSVNTAHLTGNAVTSAKLADASVGTAKLQDGSVNVLKLAENAVSTFKLVDGAVTTAKLASGAVTSNALAGGAVTLSKLATNGATPGQALVFDGSGVIWQTALGDITAVLAGSGLAGGGSNGAVTLQAIFAGNGSSNAAARADHHHNTNYAALAHTHSGADLVSGTVPVARIDGAIARTNQIVPLLLASDGAGSGLDADLLDGLHATAFALAGHQHDTNYWKLTGNSATTGGFLGTLDNLPLEFRVNTLRALRLEPGTTPNVIGGAEVNSVTAGVNGAALAGGGAAGAPNRVTDDHGTVAGGFGNQAGDGAGTTADRAYATIGGGFRNLSAADRATVGGGAQNTNRASSSTIGGGQVNLVNANASGAVIAGGTQNAVLAIGTTIGGGLLNTNAGLHGTIAGGRGNQVGNTAASIGGGNDNIVLGAQATVGGGGLNQSRADAAFIGGGTENLVEDQAAHATIAGGAQNSVAAAFTHSAVGGGFRNRTAANYTVIAGGNQNTNTGHGGAIGGGFQNQVSGLNGAIGGGTLNHSSGSAAVISGGDSNGATAEGAAIAGGRLNVAAAPYASIGGGHDNLNQGDSAALGGGEANVIAAQARASTVAGGANNRIQPLVSYATVAGGRFNTTGGDYATIGGGQQNVASGVAACIPGGTQSQAGADYAFAAGRRAKARHPGAFVWGDSTDADVVSTATNQFVVRAAGGVKLYSNSATNSGVELAPGSGAWGSVSDRNAKENFQAVDGRALLKQLVALPIQTWNYKSQHKSVRHIGPTAQDFQAAFNVGESDTRITTIDADGVSLAAIQGLHALVAEQAAELRSRAQRIEALEHRLSELEKAIHSLAAK